jgi:hypothetical protein
LEGGNSGGATLLGASGGYSAFESLNNGVFENALGHGIDGKIMRNSSKNFGDNFRAFYAGIFGYLHSRHWLMHILRIF